ncbi:MAG: hypothetical protein ACM3JB_26460 [Acidobacteriaceae bacterium]
MTEEKPSLRAFDSIVREQLSSRFDSDLIGPILASAEDDNPAAEFIVASALEAAGEREQCMKWYRCSAEQGYPPALERLRRESRSAA